jgi:hypothetical protein
LVRYCEQYVDIARRAGAALQLDTPTLASQCRLG